MGAASILKSIDSITLVACGTSYYAGSVASYWIEELAKIPCQVEIASEFRYRTIVCQANSLFVTISQSGETADTLAALRIAKESGYSSTLTICNTATSSLVRESDLALMINAGAEIGVASTKAFTAQLVDLMLLTVAIGKFKGISGGKEADIVSLYQDILSQAEELNNAVLTNNTISLFEGLVLKLIDAKKFDISFRLVRSYIDKGLEAKVSICGELARLLVLSVSNTPVQEGKRESAKLFCYAVEGGLFGDTTNFINVGLNWSVGFRR